MRSLLARLVAGALVGVAALVAAPAAHAHGDPSSHFLETGVLYPAVGDPPTQETELALLGLLLAARQNGYPIKVALVANAQDLTDDPSILQRPQDYADYIAGELSRTGPLRGPVLVVSPFGYGLAGNVPGDGGNLQPLDRAESSTLVTGLTPVSGAGGEALAVSAMAATRRLAAEEGHALPAYVPPAQALRATAPDPSSKSGGWNPWLGLGIFCGVFLFAALAYEAQRRLSASGQSEAVEDEARALEVSSH